MNKFHDILLQIWDTVMHWFIIAITLFPLDLDYFAFWDNLLISLYWNVLKFDENRSRRVLRASQKRTELGKSKTDDASENISPKWEKYLANLVITLCIFYKKIKTIKILFCRNFVLSKKNILKNVIFSIC